MEKQRKQKQKKKIHHFAECLSQNTRQRGLPRSAAQQVCRVPALGKIATWPHPDAGTLPSAISQHSAKRPHGGPPRRADFAECRTRTLGKTSNFAECLTADTRQSAGPGVAPRGLFTECQGTRQILCRVPVIRHSAKSALPWDSLPSVVCRVLHSTNTLPSVTCPLPSVTDTRQSLEIR